MEAGSVLGGLWGHWQEPGVGQGLRNTSCYSKRTGLVMKGVTGGDKLGQLTGGTRRKQLPHCPLQGTSHVSTCFFLPACPEL